MLVQPFLQIRISGRRGRGGILGQKLELLPHASADDGVVFVEAHRDRLAAEYLLSNVIFDQPVELLLCRRALPGSRKAGHELLDFAAGHDDLAILRFAAAGDEVEKQENKRAQYKKMHQRLAQNLLYHGNAARITASPACTRSATCRHALS